MKKIFFPVMVLFLVTATFFSCSKDGVEDVPLVNEKETETYSAVSILFPNTLTLRSADPDAANIGESAVTSVGVFVVDNFSGFIHKGIFNSSQFTPVGDAYKLTSAVKTTTGDKSIYVVLNPTSTILDAIDLQKAGAFGDGTINGTADMVFVTSTDVVMTSIEAKAATLSVKTEAEALAAPLSITVQRNTSKIAVKKKTATIPVVGGSVDNLQFATIVEAKKSYLIQQGGSTYETVKTPAQDINNLIADNEYFTKLVAPTSWKDINEHSALNKDLAGYYALENVNTTKLAGNTTAAIIKAQFTPSANSVVTDYATDGTRTMGTITPGTSFYVKKSDYTYWSQEAYNKALANGFTADHFSKLYENGIGYYRIWVQDANNNKGVLRNNYYILSVNKISGPGLPYVPGVDPDDNTNPGDPNLPIDEDTYISAEVTVLPWNVETSDHEI